MPSQPIHTTDLLVGVGSTLSQILVGWIYFREIKPRLGRYTTPVAIALTGIWIVVGFGILLDFLSKPYRAAHLPPEIRSFAVGVEILWSFSSGLAALAWMLWRPAIQGHSEGRRLLLKSAATASVAAPFVAVGYGTFIERTAFEVKEIELPIRGLHPDLAGLRIAQISDLHVSPFLSIREAARVIDMTNELRPGLTVMTGDLISEIGDPLDAVIRELARLKADAGVLGCLGNHEMYAECEDYTAEQARRLGVQFLRKESKQLRWGNGVLNVAGVDFQRFSEHRGYLKGTEHLVVPGATNLLLSHNPDVFPSAVRTGFDAMLAGHTHGGQVTVEIVSRTANFARFVTPYVRGLYRLDGRTCYVNTGIGTIGMPVRLGAAPEITLMRLVPSDGKT